jgi:hypothetical protein
MWSQYNPAAAPIGRERALVARRLQMGRSYSNARDKPWQMAILSGTRRIQSAISERGAAIC